MATSLRKEEVIGLSHTELVHEQEEAQVLGRIKDIIGGDFFNHITQNDQKLIIAEAEELIVRNRTMHRDPHEFFDYQDNHFDDARYAFLQQEYPGLDLTGWRVLMAELDPITYGVAIQRKDYGIHGTISARSAKK